MTRAPAAATAALVAAALASTTAATRPAQDTPPANTVPGLTLWAWRLDGQLPRWPRVDVPRGQPLVIATWLDERDQAATASSR